MGTEQDGENTEFFVTVTVGPQAARGMYDVMQLAYSPRTTPTNS